MMPIQRTTAAGGAGLLTVAGQIAALFGDHVMRDFVTAFWEIKIAAAVMAVIQVGIFIWMMVYNENREPRPDDPGLSSGSQPDVPVV